MSFPPQITFRYAQSGDDYRIIVTTNGVLATDNTLHAITGSALFPKFTLSNNGVIYVEAGDYISVWAWSHRDTNWTIDASSGFSGFYLGSLYSRIGFAVDLNENFLYQHGNAYELTDWNNRYRVAYLFQEAGTYFNQKSGRFTAPCTGVYYAAANLRIDRFDGKFSGTKKNLRSDFY